MSLEQRYVIKYLHAKHVSLEAITAELSSMYGQDAYTQSDIKYWIHQVKLRRTDLENVSSSGRQLLDDVDAEIISALRKYPFASVRSIADSTGIAPSTVYSHLVEQLGFRNYILRCLPHILTNQLRQKRVSLATTLLEVLRRQQCLGFPDIVTGDESWFFRNYEHNRMW
jgi:DNA-binding transcriptional ArsR family regulator